MNAEQVLLAQFDFLQRSRDQRFRDATGRAMAADFSDNGTPEDVIDSRAETLMSAAEQHMRLAEAFRVTEDMCDLVIHAANSLDESDTYDHTLAPSPWGFVRFEKGLPLIEIRGKMMKVHHLVWGPLSHGDKFGVIASMFNDPITEPDDIYHEMMKAQPDRADWFRSLIGRWAYVATEMLDDGQNLGPTVYKIPPEEVVRRNSDVASMLEMKEFGLEPSDITGDYTNPGRYIHALWLLLGQTITATESEPIKSSVRKRIGKMRIPAKVTVIMLRRKAGGEHNGETHVEWQHRWLVRGHWAWRVCSDKHPAAQPAPVKGGIGTRVWINGYVKGPEDKPLLPQQHVYQFSR